MLFRNLKTCYIILSFILFMVHSSLAARELTFVLWNAENLFDTQNTPKKSDSVVTNEEYERKIEGAARIIKGLAGDIVGLCEVENKDVLADLAARSGYSYYYLVEGNDPRGIDVGMLSRYPLEYVSHKDQLTPYQENKHYKFSRDCVEAVLKGENGNIYILLTHLKSMVYDDGNNEKKRVAQTKGILDIILKIYQKNELAPMVLVMGDLNSYRYSEPLNVLQKAGLINLNYKMNQGTFYTTRYKGKKQDLDYMLMNNVLFENCVILNYKTINTKEVEIISDHYPVFLEIRIK